ncbi:PREDICTED: uncharacterized protein LOC102860347 [Elephantulus edwardii]|uniref:uncharacterized protein LOC102860347 n=1 Tax=Elephantulus edwardii TaxID=28737 RepID=UPI0003F0992B|nr:PREDICTED: uncharacterized protein LOC102860347 [Elephantulus edwardii]
MVMVVEVLMVVVVMMMVETVVIVVEVVVMVVVVVLALVLVVEVEVVVEVVAVVMVVVIMMVVKMVVMTHLTGTESCLGGKESKALCRNKLPSLPGDRTLICSACCPDAQSPAASQGWGGTWAAAWEMTGSEDRKAQPPDSPAFWARNVTESGLEAWGGPVGADLGSGHPHRINPFQTLCGPPRLAWALGAPPLQQSLLATLRTPTAGGVSLVLAGPDYQRRQPQSRDHSLLTLPYGNVCTHVHTRCAHTRVHVHKHMCTHVNSRCIHTHVHVHKHVCTHVRTRCVHTRVHVHKHVCTHIHTPCIHTHVHVHKHVCTHVHTHVHVHAHTYMCTNTCLHKHVCTHVHTHVHVHAHTFMHHSHAYMCTRTQTHVYTLPCAHVHTCTQAQARMHSPMCSAVQGGELLAWTPHPTTHGSSTSCGSGTFRTFPLGLNQAQTHESLRAQTIWLSGSQIPNSQIRSHQEAPGHTVNKRTQLDTLSSSHQKQEKKQQGSTFPTWGLQEPAPPSAPKLRSHTQMQELQVETEPGVKSPPAGLSSDPVRWLLGSLDQLDNEPVCRSHVHRELSPEAQRVPALGKVGRKRDRRKPLPDGQWSGSSGLRTTRTFPGDSEPPGACPDPVLVLNTWETKAQHSVESTQALAGGTTDGPAANRTLETSPPPDTPEERRATRS